MVKSNPRFDTFSYSRFTIYHLLVFRHYFLTTLKYLAHHALLWHREYFQAISAPLIQLLALHVGHLRQVSLGPRVLDKLERVILSKRMPFPIRRQKYSSQVRMVIEAHSEKI